MGLAIGMLAFVVFLVVMICLVTGFWYGSWKRHQKASKGIINYDFIMQSFCYRTSKSKEEILECLRVHSASDCMMFEFDEEHSEITFSPLLPDGTMPTNYTITIGEGKGFSVLKITQNNHRVEKNGNMYLLQNEFWHKKIDADPIKYFE